MAPPDTGAPGDAADQDRFVTSGNLVAPVVDAGDAGDASDAGDADSGPKK